MMMGFLTTGSAADFGWVAYAPLSNSINTPGAGPDLWIVALILTGFSAIFTGVNLVSTIYYLRAPGMTMFRMPIFTWNMLVTGILILIAFPVFTSALVMLVVRPTPRRAHLRGLRRWGAGALAGPVLVLRPSRGLHPRPALLRDRDRRDRRLLPKADLRLSRAWSSRRSRSRRCRRACGRTTCSRPASCCCPFFSLMSYLIAVPTGIKFFNWIGTMWRGSVKFDTPMLFCLGFLVTFLIGGVTGILLASPPIDFATHDTYFVVAHFHSVVMALVMGAFAGFFYWYPKMTGRMLREGLGKGSFWFMFIGTNVTFDPQYLLGLKGHAEANRRVRRQ